ncbi:MAG: glucose-1-phosphate thymidylyltransferase [Chloroflexi bacterium]|nr:glucose-1-phosphate thymidylyltransferase [Chloroflexota bacterium]
MKGLILSGGKGTRLYPLTYTRAKQLIPVANKPVLVRAIESIRDAGVTEIGIVIGQTGPEIRATIGDGSRWHVQLTYIEQPSPDGLAHAVKISQDFLRDDPFVMFLGDNVLQGGISTLIRDFAGNPWNSQIVLKEVDNPSAFGVVKLNPDGTIERLVEKPKDPPSNLALVGIYMFDHHIFEAVHAIKPSWRGELEITDAIQWLIEAGYTVSPHVHSGWWIDTGKPTDMLEANSCVLDELTPQIAPDAVIENSEVDRRVTIESGAQIINSVIHGPTIIGVNTRIENSYVGPYTSIYHDVEICGCEIDRSIVLENSRIYDPEMRLHDCLIGRNVTVRHKAAKPKTLTMNLGDHSEVWLA